MAKMIRLILLIRGRGTSSHWLLHLLVPGQIFYDEGLTAIENRNYGLAIANFVSMFAKQYIFVISLGTDYNAGNKARGVPNTHHTYEW